MSCVNVQIPLEHDVEGEFLMVPIGMQVEMMRAYFPVGYFADQFIHSSNKFFIRFGSQKFFNGILHNLKNSIDQHQANQNPQHRINPPKPLTKKNSQLFDVLNKITIDAIIFPKDTGERELASQHLLKSMPNDLILLDRGYPAWWLFKLILSMEANFCARISCTKWKAVRSFYYSGLAEKIISLPIHATSVAQCKEMGLDMKPLKLRLIRIQNGDKVQVLVTSLIDAKRYPIDIFHDLYHKRWPIEEDYKSIKCRMELENFSGKSALSVYQDFHAKIFAKNLVSIMAFPVNNSLKNNCENRKYDYQINFTQALSKSKGIIALLFHEPKAKILKLIADLQNIFQRTIEPIRPGRKYPRNHKVSARKFFLSYKPIG